MRIGIIGGGSIGLLMSSYLIHKHQVTLYVRRNEQLQNLIKYGIKRDDLTIKTIRAYHMDQLQHEDCLFICVKQPQLSSVITSLHNSHQHIPLIFLQNGMSHLEAIQPLSNPLYVGVVEHGAKRMSDQHVLHTGKGVIRIANYRGLDEQLNTLIKQLDQNQFPFEQADNWYDLLAKKLIANAVINPLTALFHVKNRDIIDNQHIALLANHLCKEAAKVLSLNEQEEWENVQKLAKKTGANTSSMLADIQQGRKTELEAITGYLLKNSKGELPYTSFVYHSVRALEAKYGIN